MPGPRRYAFASLILLAGLLSFLAGARFVSRLHAAPTHPLTDREIAGITTSADWLDRAEREKEEDPERALDLIGIKPGMTVADVGAGTGYVTIRIARRVGPTGKVYANDLQPALLQIIRDKASGEGLANVEIVQGAEDDAHLPERAIDLALMVDVYHELSDPQRMLQSILRSLKPKGQLVLVEYRKEDPSVPIAYAHKMSVKEARIEVEAEGFTLERTAEELPRQHILVFRKAGAD